MVSEGAGIGMVVDVVVHVRHSGKGRESPQLVRVADIDAVARQPVGLKDKVVADERVDRGRPLGLGVPILEGDAKVDRTVGVLRGVDEGIVR